MTKEELIKQYPEKSFQTAFTEVEKKLGVIDATEYGVKSKKKTYSKFFEYDKLVCQLKDEVEKNKVENIDEYTSSRVKFHFSHIKFFVIQINNSDFVTNTKESNTIFKNFHDKIYNDYTREYFVTINYAETLSTYKNIIDNHENVKFLRSGKTIIDEHIRDVKELIKDFLDYEFQKKQIKKASEFANRLIENEKIFKNAIQMAENWIRVEKKAIGTSIKGKAKKFEGKADENKSVNKYWLIGSIISGICAVGLILFFICTSESGIDVSVGASLLRISTLVVISYFSFFTLSQYSNNKKIYEAYKFKAVALETMEELLLKTSSNDNDRDVILNKAISIIFKEPFLKDSNNFQSKLVEELMDVLKKKM